MPGLLIFLFSIIYNISHPQVATAYFSTNPSVPPYTQKNMLSYLNTLGDIGVASAFVFSFWKNRFLFRQKNLLRSEEFKVVLVFITAMICNSSLVVYSEITNNAELLLFALNGYGMILIGYSFFTYRYPEFMQIVLREVKSLKYEQSQLQSIDVNETMKQLEAMMKKEKLYKDEKLTLTKVSKLLAITTHQLSELLNNHQNLTFRTYVNNFRIKEAQKLLINQPKLSIIEIAYSAGFNSKAAFNAAFAEQVKCTPTIYKKNQLPSSE